MRGLCAIHAAGPVWPLAWAGPGDSTFQPLVPQICSTPPKQHCPSRSQAGMCVGWTRPPAPQLQPDKWSVLEPAGIPPCSFTQPKRRPPWEAPLKTMAISLLSSTPSGPACPAASIIQRSHEESGAKSPTHLVGALFLQCCLCSVTLPSYLTSLNHVFFLSELGTVCVAPRCHGCEVVSSLIQCLAQMMYPINGGCHYDQQLPSPAALSTVRGTPSPSQALGSDWHRAHLGKGLNIRSDFIPALEQEGG